MVILEAGHEIPVEVELVRASTEVALSNAPRPYSIVEVD